MYLLGLGFARYLGSVLSGSAAIMGLGWMVLVQVGLFALGDHFQSPYDRGFFPDQTQTPEDDETANEPIPDLLLYLSLSALAGAAVLGVLLATRADLNLASGLVMGTFFVLHSLLVIPGLSLEATGIRQIVTSLLQVGIPPAFAMLLQTGDFHRFLPLVSFPLFSLYLALMIVLSLKRFPTDLAKGRKTLLVRLGWTQGIFIHNLLVLGGFLLFGASLAFGMPIRILVPVFLAIPAAGYQIWYLSRLEDGAPVRWPLIRLLTLIIFFLPVYLILFSVWIR